MAFRLTRGQWIAVVVVVVAAALGLNAYTTRSEFCGSCHNAMGEYYSTWSGSSG